MGRKELRFVKEFGGHFGGEVSESLVDGGHGREVPILKEGIPRGIPRLVVRVLWYDKYCGGATLLYDVMIGQTIIRCEEFPKHKRVLVIIDLPRQRKVCFYLCSRYDV